VGPVSEIRLLSQAWWFTLIIPATQENLEFEAIPDKVSETLSQKQIANGMVEWLKW
jgi:hypothetical protein